MAHAYLADEEGHDMAAALLEDPEVGLVTGAWTRVEVAGALVRAARNGRADEKGLLELLDADLDANGRVVLVSAPQVQVEELAVNIVREHALRAMDAWHLAVCSLVLPSLAEPGEETRFGSRDEGRAAVAELLGFPPLRPPHPADCVGEDSSPAEVADTGDSDVTAY